MESSRPADAHFDHGEIHLLLGKVRKGQGRAQFKGGGKTFFSSSVSVT